MTTERAFKFIKEKDLPNLKEVIDILKSQGLDLYISGSAIMVPEYSDIDLLICDPTFEFKGTPDAKDFVISPRAQSAVNSIIEREGVTLKKKDHQMKSWVNSIEI